MKRRLEKMQKQFVIYLCHATISRSHILNICRFIIRCWIKGNQNSETLSYYARFYKIASANYSEHWAICCWKRGPKVRYSWIFQNFSKRILKNLNYTVQVLVCTFSSFCTVQPCSLFWIRKHCIGVQRTLCTVQHFPITLFTNAYSRQIPF